MEIFGKKLSNEAIALIAILFFAFVIRVVYLGNSALWIDEAISGIASQEILEKGVPVLDSGLLYGRALFFHYLQAGSLLFGVNDFTLRIISVLFGLLTIILGYFIGNEYTKGKSGGIITALFLAVFYLEVFYSRQGRFYQLFQLAFFASLYFLYKSKEEPKFIYLSLISFFIALDTQIAALVLAPFFILFILYYNKNKYLAIIPSIPLVWKIIEALSVVSQTGSQEAVNYASKYAGFTGNVRYLLILFIPGIIWGFKRKRLLTSMIIIPSLALLGGVFFAKYFALRYVYFIVFPLILYSSVLLGLLYEKYGKIMLLSIFFVLIFPSNLFFPFGYVNILTPVSQDYRDNSSPEINYKELPLDIQEELRNTDKTIIVFFSPSFEWYIDKPDYVMPFSMSGEGEDGISYEGNDIYSGAEILKEKPSGPYYLIVDRFAEGKLKEAQKQSLNSLKENCKEYYKTPDITIYDC